MVGDGKGKVGWLRGDGSGVGWGLENGTVFWDRNDLGILGDLQGGFVDDKDRWDLYPGGGENREGQDEIGSALGGDIAEAAEDG